MRYLSATEILVIHERVVEETGGSLGVRDEHLLLSIAKRPRAAFDGVEKFSSIFEKSASYLEAIAMYHVFVDGNKRTAITAASVFLRANGYAVTFPVEESEKFMLQVVTEKMPIEKISVWLENNSKKI